MSLITSDANGGTYTIINGSRSLLNVDDVSSVNSHRNWSTGSTYSLGPTWGPFFDTTVNLRTQNVQPTTNDFSDAWFEFKCTALSGGSGQNWSNNIEYRFGSSHQWLWLAFTSNPPISLNQKLLIHVRTTESNISNPNNDRKSLIRAYYTDPNVEDIMSSVSLAGQHMDYTTDDVEIRWRGGPSTMTWTHRCFWRG
jgi:hypothetical protein